MRGVGKILRVFKRARHGGASKLRAQRWFVGANSSDGDKRKKNYYYSIYPAAQFANYTYPVDLEAIRYLYSCSSLGHRKLKDGLMSELWLRAATPFNPVPHLLNHHHFYPLFRPHMLISLISMITCFSSSPSSSSS